MLAAELGAPLACLDLETTGSHSERDRITEIGIVLVPMNGPIQRWQSFVDPERPIPPRITQLTGINDHDVASAPTFETLAADVAERLRGYIVIAHNARFDLGFLKQSFRRVGLRFEPKTLCSVKLSRALFPGVRGHGLDALIERFDLRCTARHRALGDAEVVADFLALQTKNRLDDLIAACHVQWEQPCLPPKLDPQLIHDLPNSPGVYLFYGEQDRPIYIGKSIHLRRRVLDHFRSDHRSEKEMRLSQQTERVEWIETPGEFSALLLEAQLIKHHSPEHNRRLRRTRALSSIQWQFGANKPPRVVQGNGVLGDDFYGAFRTPTAAKNTLRDLVEKNSLCLIRTGLQHGSGVCFAYQIKRCKGVCANKESPLQHDMRLAQALAQLRLTRWPYSGAISLPEQNDQTIVWHVIDQWIYLGRADHPHEVTPLLTAPKPDFDLDTYHIVLAHLQRPEIQKNLVRLDASLTHHLPDV